MVPEEYLSEYRGITDIPREERPAPWNDTDEQQAINEQREGIEDYYYGEDALEARYYDKEHGHEFVHHSELAYLGGPDVCTYTYPDGEYCGRSPGEHEEEPG